MDIDGAAAELIDMRQTGRVVAALPELLQPANLAEAYAVQDRVVAGLLPSDEHSLGYKCACTSEIAQEALQIDRPVYGQLLSHTTSPSGVDLPADRFTHRLIEAEFGFRIGSDVTERPSRHTPESIADHIDAVIAGIEIVDYRYESWTVGALQVAADNAIHGWWIAGEPVTDWRDIDLGAAQVSVERNGQVVTTGSGTNVLGHPLNVMAWLATELPLFGRTLRSGDLVTTGVTTDLFEADASDRIVADFADVGTVEVGFV